jgi:hypothetical protein
MGSKAALVFLGEQRPLDVLVDPPQIDLAASKDLAVAVLGAGVREVDRYPLAEAPWPESGTVCAASFSRFAIVACRDLAHGKPSELSDWIRSQAPNGNARAVFMHSGVDFGALAVWERGEVRRSVSLTPDDGIAEDIGEPYLFELPFWAGEHPLDHAPDYPLPFHPLDLGNAAMAEWFGFVIEGVRPKTCIDAEAIEIPVFRGV